jgi:hypothetical protein
MGALETFRIRMDGLLLQFFNFLQPRLAQIIDIALVLGHNNTVLNFAFKDT